MRALGKTMTSFRTFALALIFSAAPLHLATAQPTSVDFSTAGRGEVFRDLPGVVTTQEHEARDNVVCVQKYVERPTNRWRELPRLMYSCTQGSLTFESNRTPPSTERELRGMDW
jgi:hypothetical protein